MTVDMDLIMRTIKTSIDVILFFNHTYMTELYYDPEEKIVYLAQCKLFQVIKYYTCFTCRGIYEEKIILVVFLLLILVACLIGGNYLGDMQH